MKMVVTGSLGHISKPLTEKLVAQGHDVTVVSSSPDRKPAIEKLGARAAIGTMESVDFLANTFTGADVVYAMEALHAGSFFNHDIHFVEASTQIGRNYQKAVTQSGITQLVHLSSIGAHMPKGNGILQSHYLVEQLLLQLPDTVRIKFMRPVGFYYNMFAYIPTIRQQGLIIQNYGGDASEPWVSTNDIATVVAEEMQTPFDGRKTRYIASDEISPNGLAQLIGQAIQHPALAWQTVSDEQVLESMVKAGMNPVTAAGVVEMNAARRGDVLYQDYRRHRPVLGTIKLTDFMVEFAEAYRQKA